MKSWVQFPTLYDTNVAAYTVIPALRRWRQESRGTSSHPDYIGSSKPTGLLVSRGKLETNV